LYNLYACPLVDDRENSKSRNNGTTMNIYIGVEKSNFVVTFKYKSNKSRIGTDVAKFLTHEMAIRLGTPENFSI